MASSPSCSSALCPPAVKHDVFLSFRGEDTRDNFTSHLYDALRRAKVETYIDDRLHKGEAISPSLKKTIEESEISVIIFSKHYASSIWCLDELEKILECKEKYGRVVIPVFYGIDPSNVRKQNGSYADAFAKHEQKFKDNMQKVRRWKNILTQAASLSGWDSNKIRPESKLVTKIVMGISRTLIRINSYTFEGVIGIHQHIVKIEALLKIGSPDVRILGIWGMGGIGKTTIADVIFHQFKTQFESCYFVANVREQLTRVGLDQLQSKCLLELLEDETIKDKDIGTHNIRSNRLQRKKILLVFDDVDSSIQAQDLVIGHDWFGLGSRIIMTTRDKQVLKNAQVDKIYHVNEMNFHYGLPLFSWKAFKQLHPTKNYMELSNRVVNYCQGIPLALKLLGSFLCGKGKQEWVSALRSLEKSPEMEIFNVLKLSYDELKDEHKEIFLDIACFYRGAYIHCVKERLDSCGFSPEIGIRVLVDKSLISIDGKNKIVMHDLIAAMGQEVVRQQSITEVGKRSRIWKNEDVFQVLKNNTGTKAVRAISLDMSKMIRQVSLNATTFDRMHNLIMLDFYVSTPSNGSQLCLSDGLASNGSQVCLSDGLESFPDALRILRWDKYSLQSLPSNFCPENLVQLCMHDSHLQKLWNGFLRLPNLRLMDLRDSKHLIEVPDLCQTPNIEKINLDNCVSLVALNSSSSLTKLHHLCLDGCHQLRSVGILTVHNGLRTLSWDGCPLPSLPLGSCLQNLVELYMSASHLQQLWVGEQHLPSLKYIDLSESKYLIELPNLSEARNIAFLILNNCTSLRQVYSSGPLVKLRRIQLLGCKNLRSINLESSVSWRSRLILLGGKNHYPYLNLG